MKVKINNSCGKIKIKFNEVDFDVLSKDDKIMLMRKLFNKILLDAKEDNYEVFLDNLIHYNFNIKYQELGNCDHCDTTFVNSEFNI